MREYHDGWQLRQGVLEERDWCVWEALLGYSSEMLWWVPCLDLHVEGKGSCQIT